MSKCVKIVRTSKRICAGSLNKKIQIQVREIKAPVGGDVDFGEEFTSLRDVWAMVETVVGKTTFDDTQTESVKTHSFYIRYIPAVKITSENWILFNNNRYDILTAENLNEENRFYKLDTVIRGNKNKLVNLN